MVSLQGSDRRNFNRIYARLDVSTCIENEKFDAYMQNLSSSGIQIVDTPQNGIGNNEDCKIIIPIDENKSLQLDAQIVWVRNGLVGLTFINMDKEIRSHLNQLVLSLIKQTVAVDGMEVFG